MSQARRTAPILFLPIAVLLILALLLRPWRNIAGQDDAIYAVLADLLAAGHFQQPNLLLAAAWPQGLIGALARIVVPGAPSLGTYMFLAFCSYSLNLFLAAWLIGAGRPDGAKANRWVWLLGIFLFPVTLQYGLGFLSESFTISFLLLYLVSVRAWLRSSSLVAGIGVVIFSAAIMAQRQTSAVVLGGCVLFLGVRWLRKQTTFRMVVPPLLGLVAAVVTYAVLPKSFLQTSYLGAVSRIWTELGAVGGAIALVSRFVQLTVALGLFLWPSVFFFRWRTRDIAWCAVLMFICLVLFYVAPIEPLSAGVLFTNYFPKILGSALIAVGVWGLYPFVNLAFRMDRLEALAVACVWGVFCLFTAFANGSDIKYILPLAITLGVLANLSRVEFLDFGLSRVRRTALVAATMFVGAVSVLVNLYYLNTIEARWAVAKQLEGSGVDPFEISAGYGRDMYVAGERCLQRILVKIEATPVAERAPLIRDHIWKVNPRMYEDGAVFRYLVKPSQIFGKRMVLKVNALQGQSEQPVDEFAYEVAGLRNSLAIYRNDQPVKAWCDLD